MVLASLAYMIPKLRLHWLAAAFAAMWLAFAQSPAHAAPAKKAWANQHGRRTEVNNPHSGFRSDSKRLNTAGDNRTYYMAQSSLPVDGGVVRWLTRHWRANGVDNEYTSKQTPTERRWQRISIGRNGLGRVVGSDVNPTMNTYEASESMYAPAIFSAAVSQAANAGAPIELRYRGVRMTVAPGDDAKALATRFAAEAPRADYHGMKKGLTAFEAEMLQR